MRALGWCALYGAVGAGFLWAGASQGVGFYALPGLGFLALAAWEAGRRRSGKGWNPSLSLAYGLLALCYVYQGISEPTGFHVGAAVCWSLLGALYAGKAVRDFRRPVGHSRPMRKIILMEEDDHER